MTGFVVQISSGVGPIEVRRFVGKLAARLAHLCESRGLAIADVAFRGDEAAPRSVELRVAGERVPAWLGAEEGSHVLVHRSPARGRTSRKRWFAAVAILPAASGGGREPQVARDALVIRACRAGGPGGQHVNKVATAVRVEHAPSGIVVRVASARSQKVNIDQAISRIEELLRAQESAGRALENGSRRRAHYRLVRGDPVRAYSLSTDGTLLEAARP